MPKVLNFWHFLFAMPEDYLEVYKKIHFFVWQADSNLHVGLIYELYNTKDVVSLGKVFCFVWEVKKAFAKSCFLFGDLYDILYLSYLVIS